MEQSESIKALAEALASAQAEMPVVQKDSINPFLKNKFASLGAIITAVRPILGAHGLAISQFPTSDITMGIGITTMLTHKSGEWMRDTVFLSPGEEKGKSLAQVAGSVLTYLRRYSLGGVLGVVTEDDSDGSMPQKEEKVVEAHARMWSMELKQAIVDAQYAVNLFDAKGRLDYSQFAEDVPVKNAMFWAKSYRAARDEDLPPKQAAERANDEYEAEKVRRKQDKANP
jgi:hypothetical protein